MSDQNEFLLRSLEDLEREHDAGDLDDDDYQVLKDDYTARAAASLRARSTADAPPGRSRRRSVVALAGVVAFAVVAGVLVAQASGRREEDDSVSGSVSKSVTELLNEAVACFQKGDADCTLERYDEVLATRPGNVEALTYKGWATYTLLGDTEGALDLLIEAASTDPEYPDAHAFLAVLFFRNGLYQQASNELDRLDALDPPSALLEQIDGLRARVDAALAAAATSTTDAG